MNSSEPTQVGSFTLWVILALVALVILALVFAMGGDDESETAQPVGFSMSASHLPRA